MTLDEAPRPAEAEARKLTPTQFRVLQGVHLGLANKQIAFDLGIAEATVKAHMTALMRKLKVRNRTQVALLAEKMDLAEQLWAFTPQDAQQ
ncbi:MAG: helix-turn-helix transcriptional regulator [Sphingobium sp. 66-54]|nr:MAG: helix-turn-helix transcriptional regulator [Sphingobium sp. 66-54]